MSDEVSPGHEDSLSFKLFIHRGQFGEVLPVYPNNLPVLPDS